MSSVIKTGLLAFGSSGKHFHAPFLDAHKGFEFAAVVERSKSRAQQLYPCLTRYNSVDDLLADDSIDLVVVNTPNTTHYEFALKAIKHNKHVLLEKPFTVTLAQAEDLFEQARYYNCHVLAFQNRRFDSDFLSVKKILDSGQLGQLVEAHFRFDRFKNELGPKQAKEARGMGNGILYDLGPHLLDQAISLFGSPLDWNETLGYFRRETRVDDYACIDLEFPGNLHVTLTMSLLVADVQPAYILNGTQGSYVKKRADVQERQLLCNTDVLDPQFGIEDSGNEGILTTVCEQGTRTVRGIVSDQSSYINLFESVFRTIKQGQPYPVSKEQILKQLEILES